MKKKTLTRKFSLMGIVAVCLSLLSFMACNSEPKVSMTYSFSVSQSSNMQTDLSNFVTKRCNEANQTIFGEKLVDSKECEQLFNDFCDRLAADAATQGGRIFDNTWVEFCLIDVAKKTVAERRITFVKNSDPKCYVRFLFKEIAPNGDVAKATTFFDGFLVTPFSMIKSSTIESGNTVNTYTFYQEYPTYADAKAYYNSKASDLSKVVDNIDKQWPSEALYTGKISFVCECIQESPYSSVEERGSLILHRPNIIGNWTTSDPGAPFASVVISKKSTGVAAPFFATYKTTLGGTLYEVDFLGKVVGAMNPDGTIKHAFMTCSATAMQLIRLNGQDITNGAIYTKTP